MFDPSWCERRGEARRGLEVFEVCRRRLVRGVGVSEPPAGRHTFRVQTSR